MTGVASPLRLNPAGPTVLIGYEPNLGMFAGFSTIGRAFTPGSPSVQIDIGAVHEALQDGFGFCRKDNTEIAIGIRPDQFMNYVRNADELHRLGPDLKTFKILEKASALMRITSAELASLTTARKRIVQTVSRLSRDANFRDQVLTAYGNRCAVTRLQLRLVEAAHILPVPAPGSADHVSNGIALSPTYHRAFDRGLIYLDDKHCMRVNREREAELVTLKLVGGMAAFKSPLGKIHLPADPAARPDPKFIRRANKHRRIG